MTPLTIAHATGIRTVQSYTVRDSRAAFAVTPVTSGRAAAYSTLVAGDALENPELLEVTLAVDEGEIRASMNLIYTILHEALGAYSITTHRGSIPVDRLVRHEVRAVALGAELALVFRVLRAGLVTVTWDNDTLTWDATSVTFDTETEVG